VSGLSRGVLVIEADERSGALITARQACDDHGRTVFALPGRVDQSTSAGPHRLIREGAVLTTNIEDIINNLDPLPHAAVEATLFADLESTETVDGAKPHAASGASSPSPAVSQRDVVSNLTERQQLILSHLDSESLHVDQLIERTALPPQEVLGELTLLSLRGVVRRVDGQSFARAKGAKA
jgi:DNA processing protein